MKKLSFENLVSGLASDTGPLRAVAVAYSLTKNVVSQLNVLILQVSKFMFFEVYVILIFTEIEKNGREET